MIERYIEIDGEKFFVSDIKSMNKNEIKTFCSFLYKEHDLNFVRNNINENFHHIVDNIFSKF